MISLREYCDRAGIPHTQQQVIFRKYNHPANYFQFHPMFYMQANHIGKQPEKHYHDIGITQSRIFHPRQLELYYPSAYIHEDVGVFKVDYEDRTYYLGQFCQEYFYKVPTQIFLDQYATIIENTVIDSETVTIFTIGNNYDVAYEMIQELALAMRGTCMVITYFEDPSPILLELIHAQFPNRLLIKTLNLGSDIQPALIAYHQVSKLISFNYVLKLHTKSRPDWRKDLIECFYQGIDGYISILKDPKQKVGMIGSKKYLANTQKHRSNYPLLKLVYGRPIITPFIGGTMFICKRYVMDHILTRELVLRNALFQPFYHNINLFRGRAPAHTLEQMFGVEVTLMGEKVIGAGLGGTKSHKLPKPRTKLVYSQNHNKLIWRPQRWIKIRKIL